MMRKTLCGLVLGAMAAPASATLLVYEPFNYSPAGAEISTADGPGGWLKVPTSPTVTSEPTVATGNLSYPGLPWTPAGNSIAMTGGAASLQSSSTRQINGQPFISSEQPTLYYSMLFNVGSVAGTASGSGSFVAGFRNNTTTNGLAASEAGAPLLIRQTGTGTALYQLGTGLTQENGDRTWETGTHAANETLLLVLSYQFVDNGADYARLWINPDPSLSEVDNSGPDGAVGNALKVVTTPPADGHGIRDGKITNFFLRNNGSAPDNFTIDELRISNSWADVFTTTPPGLWLGGTGNWSDGANWSLATVPNSNTINVKIDDGNVATSTVALDQDATTWDLTVSPGDALNVQSGRTLTVAGQTAIGGVVNSSGTMTTKAIAVGPGGELHYNAGAMTATSVQLTSGGKLLMSAGGGKTLKATSLSIDTAGGSKLDVADNKVIIANGSVGTSTGGIYTGLTGLIQSGSNGGAWDGNGIITSTPDAATGLTSLGIATGEQTGYTGSTFGGIIVADTDVLIMYTYAGDANLDGFISGDDYSTIDFNVGTGAYGWYNGDFNYDGIVSGDDYSTIDFNYAAQGAPFPIASSPAGAGAVAVPEPAGLLWAAAALLLKRRRRV
ncbi:MAG: hypothetical protein QOF78_467 [Phycisphaerales bacterium]|jgi:hypothetical protein|nr:hypothetical protein [Phycisphaerales bacterium]